MTACMLAGRGCHDAVNASASIPRFKTSGDSDPQYVGYTCTRYRIVHLHYRYMIYIYIYIPLHDVYITCHIILSLLPSGKNERLPGLVESSSGECRSCSTALICEAYYTFVIYPNVILQLN